MFGSLIIISIVVQYHTHRQRMKMVGREDDLEKINRIALKLAKEVAEETGTLFAGGISRTDLFCGESIEDPSEQIRAMFEEQVRWAKEEGVDYIIAETFFRFKEAKIALEVIKSFNLPAVITFAVSKDGVPTTVDGVTIATACRQLIDMGATLVGVNCSRGPATILDVVEAIIKEVPPEKVCALPVTFRTTKEEPTWLYLTDKGCPENNPVFPNGIDAFYVSEVEIVKFTKRCLELGMKYIGICCGNTGNYTRAMAEAMGRTPPASKYRKPEVVKKAFDQFNKVVDEEWLMRK